LVWDRRAGRIAYQQTAGAPATEPRGISRDSTRDQGYEARLVKAELVEKRHIALAARRREPGDDSVTAARSDPACRSRRFSPGSVNDMTISEAWYTEFLNRLATRTRWTY